MSDDAGRFIWYELMTADTKAAEAFYTSVVGWSASDAGMPGMPYTIFARGEAMIAGLMAMPEAVRKQGGQPAWSGYIAVDDVDAAVERVRRLGGVVHMAPTEVPGVGRFAVAADPQGAVFLPFRPLPPPTPPVVPAPGSLGTIGWRELYSSDWEKAFAFYSAMFGWTKDQAMDMGAMGTYQLFATADGQPAIGGMFNKPAQVPVDFWLYYFVIDEIDAAGERVKANGGKVVYGPMEVPGGAFIVQCLDPQGAMFALTGPRK